MGFVAHYPVSLVYRRLVNRYGNLINVNLGEALCIQSYAQYCNGSVWV